MNVTLSGAIVSRRLHQQGQATADTSTDAAWVCQLCGKENEIKREGESSPSGQCMCCARDRDPLWLWLDKDEVQLQIGTRVQLPDDTILGTRVGVVLGVDYFKQRIQVLAISNRAAGSQPVPGQREQKSASGRRSKYRFEALDYDSSQLQQLIPISAESTDQVQELIAALECHGVCGDCRRVFRVAQGNVSHESTKRETIRGLEDELRRAGDVKSQNIKLRDYDRVLENTTTIQNLQRQLAEQKRTVEFLPTVSCPHCGWSATRNK